MTNTAFGSFFESVPFSTALELSAEKIHKNIDIEPKILIRLPIFTYKGYLGLLSLAAFRARLSDENMKTVLFVCVHNAGRSQMAAGYMQALSNGKVTVLSAGSAPKDSINPIAVQVMAEEGIDIANNQPKVLTTEAVKESDVVVTMGCGDTCPFFPGKRYEDWVLDDPAGQDIETVRMIRDEIKTRVKTLLSELIN
jgi:protein-tyrosine-phosphatase